MFDFGCCWLMRSVELTTRQIKHVTVHKDESYNREMSKIGRFKICEESNKWRVAMYARIICRPSIGPVYTAVYTCTRVVRVHGYQICTRVYTRTIVVHMCPNNLIAVGKRCGLTIFPRLDNSNSKSYCQSAREELSYRPDICKTDSETRVKLPKWHTNKQQ